MRDYFEEEEEEKVSFQSVNWSKKLASIFGPSNILCESILFSA
jgi:hypothetical protein